MLFDNNDFDYKYAFFEIPNDISLEVPKKKEHESKHTFFEIPGSDFNKEEEFETKFKKFEIPEHKMENSHEMNYIHEMNHNHKMNHNYEMNHNHKMNGEYMPHTETKKHNFFTVPGSDFNLEKMETKYYNVSEGFEKGNMFKKEYEPYKNYTYYKLNPRNEKEEKLFRVMELSFAINDFNLYLDLHPEDMEAYAIFKEIVAEEKRAHEDFIGSYGPLEIDDTKYKTYEWLKNPWPWDNEGGSMYV